MTHPLLISVTAGILAGALFLLALSGQAGTGGLFLVHAPLLSLFLVGWYYGLRAAIWAVLSATVLVVMLSSGKALFVWLGFSGIPAIIFLYRALLWRQTENGEKEWYPLLYIAQDLTLYTIAVFLLLLAFTSEEPGGLQGVLLSEMDTIFSASAPKSDMVREVFTNWTFLILAFNGWMWVLMLFIMGLLAHFILDRRAKRPSMALTYAPQPLWLLGLLAASAIASISSIEAFDFAGKTLFTLLLLPYVVAGVALMNQASREWPARGLWLTLIYFFTLLSLWPALFFAGWGIFKQCMHLSKQQSSGTTP